MDGSFSEELSKTEVQFKDHPGWTALANFDYREVVQGIYEDWITLGCRIITANTYHHCYDVLEPIFGDDNVKKAFRQAVNGGHVARFAKYKENEVVLLVSIGSYATKLRDGSEYTGAYAKTCKREDVFDYYRKQLEMADNSDHDGILFETIPTMKDVDAIIQLSKNSGDCVVSLSLEKLNLRDGTPMGEAIELLLDADNVIGIGINCTDPRDGESQLQEIVSYGWLETHRFIFIYPNSGESFVNGSYQGERAELHKLVDKWHRNGAIAIGGCCRVGLNEMKLIKEAVYDINQKIEPEKKEEPKKKMVKTKMNPVVESDDDSSESE
ncbi:hypothetical protein PFISCL1PPCAC_28758 [Pristionchus fissidentatus]|uniref:Hcy-binding domain-containing protein n=1 Tax=Pristionchus fissidentatus TaxID=1538716 RepID=A0AAV5X1W0_9BILA|nr:hypothetical protein PFISCL1PPCAC_26970 [Pristionchus fissidentatus]GMT37461.1 hypothetical protein PFISCL1PPCAC_28758 [Pristionchus fissidentatus]